MSTPVSLNTAFALALAAQTESVGLARLDTASGSATTPRPERANLLATLDPTRAAFASALLSLDVANAPEVAGRYTPGAASGPLTEDDIFDPSNLYSLPGQELVVFEGSAEASTAAIAASVRPGSETISTQGTLQNAGANLSGAFNGNQAGHPGGAAARSAFAMASGSKLPLEAGVATNLDVKPSTLTLELVVAGYMSLRQAGLSPTKRKILRRLKPRAAPVFDDPNGSGAEEADVPRRQR